MITSADCGLQLAPSDEGAVSGGGQSCLIQADSTIWAFWYRPTGSHPRSSRLCRTTRCEASVVSSCPYGAVGPTLEMRLDWGRWSKESTPAWLAGTVN